MSPKSSISTPVVQSRTNLSKGWGWAHAKVSSPVDARGIHFTMGHNLCLHFGADEHPCTSYFDVHQGYRVLTHSHFAPSRNSGMIRSLLMPTDNGRKTMVLKWCERISSVHSSTQTHKGKCRTKGPVPLQHPVPKQKTRKQERQRQQSRCPSKT